MADAPVFPVSYRDPQYAAIDASVSSKLGLPDGLLESIRVNGEKTNADRVSDAGGRTPYQIIPATREQAIKKWGIDPYLSPKNAAEVAGLLLKDSLQRNKGDAATAVAEYHGGTDPANWGPKTKAYVQRVTSALQDMPAPSTGATVTDGVQLPGMAGPSTFDRAQKLMQEAQAPNQLQALYQAYQSGQMPPEDAQQYEADVRAGRMMLPRGASLKDAATAGPGVGGAVAGAGAQPLPAPVLQAYQSGQMTPQEMAELEHDVRGGAWQLPAGVTADSLFGPQHQPTGVLDRLKNAVTGEDRRTATTEALPDWAGMPEMNQMSVAGAKAGLGTLLANPAETAQIIKANFPGVQVRQDQRGNFILRSSVDGQEYAIKPGFQPSDIPRAAAGALAFTPAGGARTVVGNALANAGTQAAIEATQAATGGNFDTHEVRNAALFGAAVPAVGRVLETAAQPAKALINRVMGRTEPAVADVRAAVTPGGAAEAGASAPASIETAPAQPIPTTQRAALPTPAQPNVLAADLRTAPVPAAGAPGSREAIDTGIAQLEGRYNDLLATTGGSASPGAITEARSQLAALQQAPVDKSEAAVRAVAKQLQEARGVSYKTALSQAKSQVADQAADYEAKVSRLQRVIEANRNAEQALQQLHEVGSQLNVLRAQRDALPPALNPIADAVRQIKPQASVRTQGMEPATPATPVAPLSPPSAATAVVPVAPAVAPATVEQVAQIARAAAGGSKQAVQELAAAAAPNAETQAAAERLGISNYLQPDHVTSNDAFRQVVGVLKSNPTGQLALQEKEGLAKVAERASSLIDEVGGTNDLSAMDASVKQRMQATHTELSARENKLYDQLREKVGPTTDAPATNALAFAEQRAKDLGGEKNLSPMEKAIVAKLSPKGGGDAAMLDALGPAAKQQAMEQGAGAIKQPTYALLDDVRRDVGAAARAKGPFSDADTGLAKKYYGLLTQDQGAVAEAAGAGEIAQAARAATVARKGMEDDLSALFGKNLDQSLVPQVSGAMKAAAGGDAAKLLAVLKATPDSMKQEVVASGLGTVFRNAATRGEMNFTGYAKWYEQLQRNKQAYAAVMSNLPPAARTQLADLYRVSKGISDSLNARIKTGLRSSVLEEMKAPENLAARLFDLAKHAGKGLAADALGGHGAGLAMGLFSALKGGAKPNAVKAIDELLTSSEFQHLAAGGAHPPPEAVRRFAYSKAFTKFARAVGNPRELSNRERWVLEALQTRNNME